MELKVKADSYKVQRVLVVQQITTLKTRRKDQCFICLCESEHWYYATSVDNGKMASLTKIGDRYQKS